MDQSAAVLFGITVGILLAVGIFLAVKTSTRRYDEVSDEWLAAHHYYDGRPKGAAW